jgi:hypothetical protein
VGKESARRCLHELASIFFGTVGIVLRTRATQYDTTVTASAADGLRAALSCPALAVHSRSAAPDSTPVQLDALNFHEVDQAARAGTLRQTEIDRANHRMVMGEALAALEGSLTLAFMGHASEKLMNLTALALSEHDPADVDDAASHVTARIVQQQQLYDAGTSLVSP